MDSHLKRLAEAGLRVSEAEEAIGAGEFGAASKALDEAGEHLAELRERWPGMRARERAVVGKTAAPLRARLDAAAARLPRRGALSDGVPERDAGQELDPAAPAPRR